MCKYNFKYILGIWFILLPKHEISFVEKFRQQWRKYYSGDWQNVFHFWKLSLIKWGKQSIVTSSSTKDFQFNFGTEEMAENVHPQKAFGWAARDTSGILSPFHFFRRYLMTISIHFLKHFIQKANWCWCTWETKTKFFPNNNFHQINFISWKINFFPSPVNDDIFPFRKYILY